MMSIKKFYILNHQTQVYLIILILSNVQVYCQKHFTNKGYGLVDVLDEYSTGYLYCNQPGYGEELLVVFGDSQNETLLIPIGYKDYEYEDPYNSCPTSILDK